MKKKRLYLSSILSAILYFFFTAQCSRGESTSDDVSMTNPSKIDTHKNATEVFREVITAYNNHDLTALIALFDPDLRWTHQTASKIELKGRAALAKQLMHERSIFPDCQIGIERILARGSQLIVQGIFRATHQGVIYGLAPSGKKVSYAFVYFVTVKNGKISSNQAFFNPAEPLRQIGAIIGDAGDYSNWPEEAEIVEGAPDPLGEERLKRFYALWGLGRYEQLNEVATSQFVLADRTAGRRVVGLDSMIRHLQKGHNKQTKVDVQEIVSLGPFIAAQVIVHGQYEMIPKDGKKSESRTIAVKQVHVVKVDNQQLVQIEIYGDEFEKYKQFGYSFVDAISQLK